MSNSTATITVAPIAPIVFVQGFISDNGKSIEYFRTEAAAAAYGEYAPAAFPQEAITRD